MSNARRSPNDEPAAHCAAVKREIVAHGQDYLKRWWRQDMKVWRSNDLRALPTGYLLCGPVGTGKTYLGR